MFTSLVRSALSRIGSGRNSCRGLFIVLLALSLFIDGCALVPPRKIPAQEIKFRYGTIGIVKAKFLPELVFDTYAIGGSSGALKGAGDGALVTIRGACSSGSGSGQGAAIVCALGIVLSPLGAMVGSVVGAVNAVPEDKANYIQSITRKTVSELNVQGKMMDHVVRHCGRLTDYRFVLLEADGPDAIDREPDYRPLHRQGILTVLEVSVRKFGFRGGTGSDPAISFFMDVSARVIRTENGEVIHLVLPVYPQDHSYVSPARTINEWAANGCRLLNDEIEKCYSVLASQIGDSAFLEAVHHRLQTVSPKVTLRHFLFRKRIVPQVDSLRPKLAWETLPASLERAKVPVPNDISGVTYEVKVWEAQHNFPEKLVYSREGLTEASHEMEKALEPSKSYYWHVRARFKLGVHEGTTAAAYPAKPNPYYFKNDIPIYYLEEFAVPSEDRLPAANLRTTK